MKCTSFGVLCGGRQYEEYEELAKHCIQACILRSELVGLWGTIQSGFTLLLQLGREQAGRTASLQSIGAFADLVSCKLHARNQSTPEHYVALAAASWEARESDGYRSGVYLSTHPGQKGQERRRAQAQSSEGRSDGDPPQANEGMRKPANILSLMVRMTFANAQGGRGLRWKRCTP